MTETFHPPQITRRALIKQTRDGWRVDEVSISVTQPVGADDTDSLREDTYFPPGVYLRSIGPSIAKAHREAQAECDRLNTEATDAQA